MKRLYSLLLLFILCQFVLAQNKKITIAWLSDTHFDSFAYAEDDLRQAVEDINANKTVDFIVISGDLAEFGETKEFVAYKSIISKFEKPCLVVPGNHDVNWSENGCSVFEKIFGSTHFVYDYEGIRFIGLGVGPMMRMGAPFYPRKEIDWLRKMIGKTDKHTPVVFINHYPMDEPICNGHEVMELLKRRNIELVLSGHEHKNDARSFENIPGIVGRSLLRRKDPIGGYNLITIENGTATVCERIIKSKTLPAWDVVTLKPYVASKDSCRGKDTVSYAINKHYPQAIERWRINEHADITSQAEIDGNFYVYTTVAGCVVAVNAKNGHIYWRYTTGNMIHSAPFITKDAVYASSCDGFIYALNRSNGHLIWKYNTGYPVVACPLVVDGMLYIGSSNGKFYAFNAQDGKVIWIASGLVGFVESRPTVDIDNVYIGTWGAKFYAFSRKTGVKQWEFDTGMGRYFSPGACWPVMIGKYVFIQSSDYYLRAFDASGNIIWKTNQTTGREAIGLSADAKTLYVQSIGNTISALDLTRTGYPFKWITTLPYKENFLPTRLGISGHEVFVASGYGIVYAIADDGSGLLWEHKISNSAVTSFCTASDGSLIATTMDGKIVSIWLPKQN